jgi:ribosomal protein S18 acetylase RimI-like enzyme
MPVSFRIELKIDPPQADVSRLEERLREYNRSQVANPARTSLLISMLGVDNELIGGVFGRISYQWLFVDILWIAEQSRHQGQGRSLLQQVEQEASRRGCKNAWLDTFSFQARSFYEKNGYTVFGELADYPPGHTRYFLRKSL